MKEKSAQVIPFSLSGMRTNSPKRTRCIPLKIRGEVTFSRPKRRSLKPNRPLLALSEDERPILMSLRDRLTRLDDEQLQVIEAIAAAMERGAL